VGVQPVPDEDDRVAELLVGSVEDAGKVVLAKAFRLAFAAAVQPGPVRSP
jgi:hypothetical protein